MNWLKKLPGYRRTPYGKEGQVLRMIPTVGLAGTVLPGLMAWFARWWMAGDNAAELARRIQLFDYMMLGLVIFIWTLALTVSIGCVIVWLMKGPAYVADGYDVSHSDHPKP
jgi:cell division protein FtsX